MAGTVDLLQEAIEEETFVEDLIYDDDLEEEYLAATTEQRAYNVADERENRCDSARYRGSFRARPAKAKAKAGTAGEGAWEGWGDRLGWAAIERRNLQRIFIVFGGTRIAVREYGYSRCDVTADDCPGPAASHSSPTDGEELEGPWAPNEDAR